MTAEQVIAATRNLKEQPIPAEIEAFYAFLPGNDEVEGETDLNIDFRTKIVELLLEDFSLADIYLIRSLFRSEMDCENVLERHDNIHQLCSYLYFLGQLQDVFLIYEAKFQTGHMDISLCLDWEMLYMNQPVQRVIDYVKHQFERNPAMNDKYPKIIEVLTELRDEDFIPLRHYTLSLKRFYVLLSDEERDELDDLE